MTASANTANRVNFPRLARELGLTRRQAEDIATSGLVDVSTPGPPRPRQISPDDAERLRQAVRIAAAAAIGVLKVLRLLASGAVIPSDPPLALAPVTDPAAPAIAGQGWERACFAWNMGPEQVAALRALAARLDV